MKLLPKGRKRISISDTGHRLEVVESGSGIGEGLRHNLESRLLD